MLNEILSKATISEIIKPAISKLRKVFTSKGIELIVSNENLQDAIFEHNTFILNITRNISFQEQKGNKILSEVYIDLDIQLQPKRLILDTENTEKFTVFEILKNTSNHIVILGGPGAGKTTTVRNICHTLLLGSDNLKYNFPILINLRDLPESDSIYLKIKSILGIEFFTSNKEENKKQTLLEDKNFLIKYINSYLNSLGVILVLDGLDEVNPKRLSRFNSEIQNLTLGLSESLIIITCRSASYNNYFENTLDYEICDLNRIQIEKFVNNWFEAKDESLTFLKELSSSKFYDFTLKPITLAHLCAIYEKTKKFYDKPKSIYKKLVRILIEEWDEQRGITRESNYANFDNETKFDFLSHFAYDLTTYYIHKRYSEEDFENSFHRINSFYDLPNKQCKNIVKEIEEHNGIIIKSSYDTYEFVHKSMQEYLASEYIVRLPLIPQKLIYDTNISNELAISVALSSNPNEYYYKLVFEIFKIDKLSKLFILEFLSRLQYEKPQFQKSFLIPYSFIVILNYLIDNHSIFGTKEVDDFEDKIIGIIDLFKKDANIKRSFLHFSEFISINNKVYNNKTPLKILEIDKKIEEFSDDDEQYYIDWNSRFYITSRIFDIFK